MRARQHRHAAVESAAQSGLLQKSRNNALTTAHTTAKQMHAFTLAELLVTVGVLALLALLFAQLLKSAATITTLGQKQMDADSQARELLDRMAVDVVQMVKRSDVYYHLKSSASATDCPSTECGTQPGNDDIAFYSNVPGYYASGSSGPQQSSVSMVGYRITNTTDTSAATLLNRMQRLGAGLVWNGVSTGNPPNLPVIYWAALDPWNNLTTATTSTLDIIGPQVFRFEYYYLLKSGSLSATPWDTTAGHTNVSGMRDVAAIVVDIAAIDSKSRLLVSDLTTLGQSLADYTGQGPGALLTTWRSTLDANTNLPRPAISGIRLYERYLYLSPPIL